MFGSLSLPFSAQKKPGGNIFAFKQNKVLPNIAPASENNKYEEEFSIFYQSELSWPNSDTSGITPKMLATRPAPRGALQGNNTGGEVSDEDRPKNICDRVLKAGKAPRPETLPDNVQVIRSDPPSVDIDDVEEFLVHDPLFVEFFNAFLSLPAFPEPVCFNVDTGGFEVVSDGRQRLAKQIKEAVRSQNFTPKIYRMARHHAFSDMPLIPIEDTEGPEGVKIDTTYNVTVLNKDQGIYWIKAERLPIFLESEFYFQYRLAKVISQARLFNDQKDFVVMKIDFTPRQKKVKKSVEVPPPNIEDVIVKQMFVSFGDVKGAAKEAWFTQAKDGISTDPKFTTLNPKMSTQISKESSSKPEQQQMNRPKSSVFRSPYFGTYAPGLVGPGETEPPTDDDDVLNNDMFRKIEDRPFTPRPSDKIHRSTVKARKIVHSEEQERELMFKPGSLVYVLPKQDNNYTDSDSAIGDTDIKDDEELEKKMMMGPIIDDIYNDDSWDQTPSIALKSVGELGSVIVGAVLKKTLADVLSMPESTVLQDPKISKIYPKEELTCITVDDLDKLFVDVSEGDISEDEKLMMAHGESSEDDLLQIKKQEAIAEDQRKSARESMTLEDLKNQPNQRYARWNRKINKSAEEESDADSLLDSDEDFEEQDIHFRRKKNKWFNLTSMKGIMNFKKFLSGTPGEKYWELWMDIDKGRLNHDEDEEIAYSTYLRGKYFKQGSPFELSKEDKIKLGLESPSSWHQTHLLQIQGKVMEPLVLYWAPRYLLKHLLQTDPDKYYMYSAMKSFLPSKESDPHPMTKSLLPLRPKSCCPRTRQGPGFEEMSEFRNQTNEFKASEAEFVTTPKVGNRRIYGEDTIKRLANTPTAKYLGIKAPSEPNPPNANIAGLSSRPATALSATPSVTKPRSSSGSIHSSLGEEKKERKRSVRLSIRPSQSARNSTGYVGKLPGLTPSKRGVASAGPTGRQRDYDINTDMLERCKCVADAAERNREDKRQQQLLLKTDSSRSLILAPKEAVVPCSTKKLEAVLGENFLEDKTVSGEALGPVKKPRDLLSPKLRILDTKQQRSRQASAVRRTESRESEKVTFYRQDSIESSKACDSRPASASRNGKEEMIKIAEMTDCAFMGSERMEMLLQALHHDKEAGRAFRKFMEKDEENQVAVNCFEFWDNVQEYRKLFYKDKLDLFFINKQAKVIFAQFIVNGAPKSIEVSDSIELSIMDRLRPAYEDLYDDAEEHALKILFAEFLEFLSQDVKTYCKVERSEISRRLETKNTYILNLQKKGIIKERPLTPDDPMDGYVDPVYDESIFEKIPEEFREWTFDKLVHNRPELENFRLYLAENYAEIDLKCWIDIEGWRRTPPNDAKKRDQRARDIKKLYLNKKYFFGPSSPAGKEGQNKVMEAAGGWGKFLEDKPHHDSILLAQKYVAERLEKKHLPLFLASKAFQERQAPSVSQEDLADDVGVQKKKRSQAVLKVRQIRQEASIAFEEILNNRKSGESRELSDISLSDETAVGFPFKNLLGSELSKAASFTSQDHDPEHPDRKASKDSVTRFNSLRHRTSVEKLQPVSVTGSVTTSINSWGPGSWTSIDRESMEPPRENMRENKLLESKWLSSAKEIYIFKQAIKNPVTLKQFTNYISVQGEYLENDLLFWLEVQRYKEMHHAHTEDSMLQAKISAIIQCFIDSTIPPSLQIDIPLDMAERILDHKHEKGPYLFREAQLATFRILLNHWIPFCEFRNNMGSDEKAQKTLERHRTSQLKKEQKQMEEQERERERQRGSSAGKKRGKKREVEETDFLLLSDTKDEEDDKAKISFSYSNYLSQEATANDDETQTIRSMLDKSVDTMDSDEKLLAKGEEMLMNNRRFSTTSEKRRSSEISGSGKGKCSSPEERTEQVNRLLS